MSKPEEVQKILLVKDTDTRQVVYGQIFYDHYFDGEEPATDRVVRDYLKTFCMDCVLLSSGKLNGVIPDSFTGQVCKVTETPGAKEYAIIINRLDCDSDAAWQNRSQSESLWEPALSYWKSGGQLIDPIEPADSHPNYWDSFISGVWYVISMVALSLILVMVIQSLLGERKDDDRPG